MVSEKEEVRCPNLCFNGLSKIHHPTRALYEFCKCSFCKGKGVVNKKDVERIEKEI